MSDIKLSQLPEVTSLLPTDILPNVASGTTSKITVQNLAASLPLVPSASYALNAGSTHTKFWLQDISQSLQSDETLVVSDNFVMNNSQLVLNGSAESFVVGNITFEKKAQLYVGGHMLLVDSNIVNDGIIAVAGGVILSGSSTITGTGIII